MNRVIAALLTTIALAGAAPTDEGLPEERFIDVMTELRRAAATTDQSSWEARRREILEGANVTDSMLIDFVRRHGHEIDRMRVIWDTIALRLQPEPPPEESLDTAAAVQ